MKAFVKLAKWKKAPNNGNYPAIINNPLFGKVDKPRFVFFKN